MLPARERFAQGEINPRAHQSSWSPLSIKMPLVSDTDGPIVVTTEPSSTCTHDTAPPGASASSSKPHDTKYAHRNFARPSFKCVQSPVPVSSPPRRDLLPPCSPPAGAPRLPTSPPPPQRVPLCSPLRSTPPFLQTRDATPAARPETIYAAFAPAHNSPTPTACPSSSHALP